MPVLVIVIGALTLIFGLLNFAAAKSAMHETTAAVLWCGGWLIVVGGLVLRRMNRDFTFKETVPEGDNEQSTSR